MAKSVGNLEEPQVSCLPTAKPIENLHCGPRPITTDRSTACNRNFRNAWSGSALFSMRISSGFAAHLAKRT